MKPGDTVTRILVGMPMELKVTEVTDELIICGPWKFSRRTGAEIDEDLGWNEQTTGSYLLEVTGKNETVIR